VGTLFFAAPIRVTREDCRRTPTAVAVLAGVLECAKLAISAYWRSAGVLLRLHTPLQCTLLPENHTCNIVARPS
jgi:hypothetical protein